MSSIGAVFSWDSTVLDLVAIIDHGSYPWLFCGFPSTPTCLNEVVPPANGEGLFVAFGQFPPTPFPEATPAGLLLSIFEFTALQTSPGTQVCVLASDSTCSPPTNTEIPSGSVIGLLLECQLGTISVAIEDTPLPVVLGDMNCDDVLDGEDITGFVQALLHPCEYTATVPCCDINKADMDGNGAIDMVDVPLFTAALLQP